MSAADWVDLSGKVAHVTGGARGIGRGIAEALATAGATVMVSDLDGDAARAAGESIGGLGVALDVTDSAAVDAAMERTVSELGALDIVVNNAGVYRGFGGSILSMTDEKWRTIWSVNIDGVFHCCRAAARIMVAAGRGGRIINLSSVQAYQPGWGADYDGGKAAVRQITRSLALELGPHGINVNAIAPGATWVREGEPRALTDVPPASGDPLADSVAYHQSRIPKGRYALPEEQGKVAVFLASPLSEYVTGVTIPVDGGWLTL